MEPEKHAGAVCFRVWKRQVQERRVGTWFHLTDSNILSQKYCSFVYFREKNVRETCFLVSVCLLY